MSQQMIPSKWMNEQDVCAWLGVTRHFLINFRSKYGLNHTYLTGKRVLMYDREEIEAFLEKNSLNAAKKLLNVPSNI